MDINLSRAASAYGNSVKMLENFSGGGEELSLNTEKQSSFSDLVGNALNKAIDNQYNAEQIKMGALTGKAEITDLVTAVSQAELSLNTVVAVRDRVISAYQDILRMPI